MPFNNAEQRRSWIPKMNHIQYLYGKSMANSQQNIVFQKVFVTNNIFNQVTLVGTSLHEQIHNSGFFDFINTLMF